MRISQKLYKMTPTGEFYLIGYGNRCKSRRVPAQGVHDDIFANVLVWEIDTEIFYIFNVDFIELLDDFCTGIKQEMKKRYGIPESHVLLSVTHNHQSVRDYHRTWESGKYNPAYESFLVDTIYRAYEEGLQNLQEVSVRFGRGITKGYYGNRNHQGQLADNEILKVAFIKDDKVIAGLINWAVHSTVLSSENAYLTSEFAGNVRKYYAEKAGYSPLMIVGAAGDCSTRHYAQGNDFAELARVSKAVAEQILAIPCTQSLNLVYKNTRELTYQIRYDMEEYREELELELEQCNALIEDKEARIHGISPGFYKKIIQKKLALKQVDITLFSTIINLQDMIIITIPGELASAFGIALKQLYPDTCTLIFGYTNGFLHYLMPKEEYGLSMETIDSLYPKGSIEGYVEMIKQALQELRK